MSVDISKYQLLKAMEERLQRLNSPYYTFQPQEYQRDYINSNHSDILLIAGNQAGKSVSSAWKVVDHAINNPNSNIYCVTWYGLTSLQQEKILQFLPRDCEYTWKHTRREFVNRTVYFQNGSWIKFYTYESGIEAMQSASLDIIWLDEEAPDEHYYSEIKMRLVAKGGTLIRSLTPINGISYTQDHLSRPNVQKHFWSTLDNQFLDKSAVDEINANFDERTKQMRLYGMFVNLNSGNCYTLGQENIVSSDVLPWRESTVIDIGMDFNYDHLSAVFTVSHQGIDYVFDELQLHQATTQMMCNEIKKRFPNKQFRFFVDEFGSKRSTATSVTDHSTIRSNFPTSKLYYKRVHNVRDRVLATCARLQTADGRRHLYINEKCKILINDHNNVTWQHLGEGHKKQGKLTHMSDALDYLMYYKYDLGRSEITINRAA